MQLEFKKNEIILFLFLLIAFSVIFIEKPQAKVVLIISILGLLFSDKLEKKKKKPKAIKLTPPPAPPIKDVMDRPAEMPEDPFNTYRDSYLNNEEYDRVTYRSFEEYPEDVARHINPIYDQRNYMNSADERCAQMSRNCQMRAKESIDNRVNFNINSIRPYFEEDLVSTENAPWWGDNDKFFM